MRSRFLLFSLFSICILFIAGCKWSNEKVDNIGLCQCCEKINIESDLIQDFINGDDNWLDIKLGVTKPEKFNDLFINYTHNYCFSVWTNEELIETCNKVPIHDFFDNRGHITLNLPEISCKEFWITWEEDRINSILLSCEGCISVEDLLNEIDEDPYISAIQGGINEVELLTTLLFPDRGLTITLEIMDPNNSQLTPSSMIRSILLTEPAPNSLPTTTKEWMGDITYKCSREWAGYGDILRKYYSGEPDGTCPYGGK